MKRKVNWMMRSVGDENLLVPLGVQVMSQNGLITLNKTAAYIWELLAQNRTLDELTAAVMDRFNVDNTHVRADIEAFLIQLTQLGILEL